MTNQLSPGSLQQRGQPMGAPNFSMNALFAAGAGRGPSDNSQLAKFFGNDVLRQQMPSMPPLHAQGQKVLTVDEIERRQQTVTH